MLQRDSQSQLQLMPSSNVSNYISWSLCFTIAVSNYISWSLCFIIAVGSQRISSQLHTVHTKPVLHPQVANGHKPEVHTIPLAQCKVSVLPEIGNYCVFSVLPEIGNYWVFLGGMSDQNPTCNDKYHFKFVVNTTCVLQLT